MDESPLLVFLLADLAWGKKPRISRQPMDDNSDQSSGLADTTLAADEVFRREMDLTREALGLLGHAQSNDDGAVAGDNQQALAHEVCEDAEVDVLTQPVPTVSLPFGKSD